MVEVGDGASLTSKPVQRVRVIEIPCADRLDRDEGSGDATPREVDGGHAALAELADELVVVFECAEVGGEVSLGLHRLV